MSVQKKLSDTIEALGNLYRSVEIRAAFVQENQNTGIRQGDQISRWHNLFTLIRFTPDLLSEHSHEILVDEPKVKFVIWHYPFERIWSRLVDGFSKQTIILDQINCRSDMPFSILLENKWSLMGQDGGLYPIYREEYQEKWPLIIKTFQTSARDQARSIFLNDSDISRSIERMNHNYPDLALKEFLQVSFSPFQTDGLHLVFQIPFRIAEITTNRNGSEGFDLKVSVSTEVDYERNLTCHIRQKLSTGTYEKFSHPLNSPPIRNDNRDFQDGLWTWKIEDLLTNDQDSSIEVDLFHEKLGKVETYSKTLKGLLIQEDRNPLFIALTAFCPRSTLTEILESPSKFSYKMKKSPQNNIGRLYEVTVQWLLTLLGLRAIWLHDYEDLKIESNFQLGSVDCIAYSDSKNVLLLIGCTTNAPTSEEINRIENLRTHFLTNVFKGEATKVYAVLFTGAHRPSATTIPSSDEEARVYYQEDIPGLFGYAEEGKGEEFVEEIMHFTPPILPLNNSMTF